MSTFSSNIHRVYQAIEMGIKYNRKVAIIGRSMERNLEVAMNLGYIKLPFGIFILEKIYWIKVQKLIVKLWPKYLYNQQLILSLNKD